MLLLLLLLLLHLFQNLLKSFGDVRSDEPAHVYAMPRILRPGNDMSTPTALLRTL